jgi:hypothetical protein
MPPEPSIDEWFREGRAKPLTWSKRNITWSADSERVPLSCEIEEYKLDEMEE